MNLPAGTLTKTLQQAIEIIRRLLRALVRADMTGDEAVANRQQIHTHTCIQIGYKLVDSHEMKKGGNPLYRLKTAKNDPERLQLFLRIAIQLQVPLRQGADTQAARLRALPPHT